MTPCVCISVLSLATLMSLTYSISAIAMTWHYHQAAVRVVEYPFTLLRCTFEVSVSVTITE